ncbi:MAG TPA: PilZ domain-containing protein [Candidatus Acidoferrum sp.]|nr:PilZ domain-containing protein [Candidatus Acidoferrum sp.]
MLSDAKGSFQAKVDYTRATVRLNSRVPIALEWTEDGRTLRTDGVTLDVSLKGCMAVAPQGFPVGQRLRIVNKVNGHVCDAILVWRGHEGRTGWELGLELQGQVDDFWGVDF